MSTSKPTRGPVFPVVGEQGRNPYGFHHCTITLSEDNGWRGDDEYLSLHGICRPADIHLMADAFAAHDASGLTPRELLAQRDELREALQILAAYPLEDFSLEGKAHDRPLFGANDWQLQVGHIRAARAAIAKTKESK